MIGGHTPPPTVPTEVSPNPAVFDANQQHAFAAGSLGYAILVLKSNVTEPEKLRARYSRTCVVLGIKDKLPRKPGKGNIELNSPAVKKQLDRGVVAIIRKKHGNELASLAELGAAVQLSSLAIAFEAAANSSANYAAGTFLTAASLLASTMKINSGWQARLAAIQRSYSSPADSKRIQAELLNLCGEVQPAWLTLEARERVATPTTPTMGQSNDSTRTSHASGGEAIPCPRGCGTLFLRSQIEQNREAAKKFKELGIETNMTCPACGTISMSEFD